MTSAVRYQYLVRRLAWLVLAVCLAGSAYLAYRTSRLPSPSARADGPGAAAPREWTVLSVLTGADWSVFHNVRVGPGTGSLSQRFKLAGTFCWTPEQGAEVMRKAIIDNTKSKAEYVVSVGDTMEETVQVAKITENSATLRENGIEEQIFLLYATNSAAASGGAAVPILAAGEKIVSTNMFGAYVGDGRWIMIRNRLIGYIDEIKENPSRVSAVFDSMAPIWAPGVLPNGRRRVEAYQLHVVGEKDFYDAVGLQEGDIVRRVNTMPVTSMQRAMFWINEFRDNRANSFVFDIERGGKPMRLEYIVR